MKISFLARLKKDLLILKKKDPKLFKKIEKQLTLFQQDPKYPSLKTHKLEGPLKNSWSIYIEGNIRLVYSIGKNGPVFSSIGTHDQVYKEKK